MAHLTRVLGIVAALGLAAGCGAEAVPQGDQPGPDDGGAADEPEGDVVVPEGEIDARDDGAAEAEACVPADELCDGRDNDCDGRTDEDFNLLTDLENCGECGSVCDPPNAVAVCMGGTCAVASCDPGWANPNGSAVDGCEYECTASAAAESPDTSCADGVDNDCDGRTDEEDDDCGECVPEFCDGEDNDCDGLTDEEFDVDFDPVNCGECGTVCPTHPHAVPVCVLGDCDINCEAGWEDRNGSIADGCEATCVPGTAEEVFCDGRDDDCDGLTDEDYLPYRCGTGLCQRTSICHRAEEECVPRTPPATADTSCDNVDDDCDGAVDEDWVSTTCVGACADTAVCREGVPECGPPAASDAECDGIDEDCDGRDDEDYVPYPCGVGACRRMSACAMGMERCHEGSPGVESCNGIDDDCDGATDDEPPAPDVLCEPPPHGRVECVGGACTMRDCPAGFADADGQSSNGCECALESSEGSGESCAAPIDLGEIPDTAGDVTIRGKIAPADDEDWYRFVGRDTADSTCDAYNVDVRFTENPGAAYRMDVHRGSCDPTTCTNLLDRYSWAADFRTPSAAEPPALGECPCAAGSLENNACNDNSETYYVRVYRARGTTADCSEYAIRITNGVF